MPRTRKNGLSAALTVSLGVGIGAGVGLGLALPRPAYALQEEYAPIVLKVNEDTFVRFILWNQIWSRLIENNPGALIQDDAEDWTADVGVRRARFLAFGKIGDDVLLMFHIGINNQTFLQNDFDGSGPNFFVHDAWTEFKIIDVKDVIRLDFGGGLIYWNGISRMTNASTLNFMSIDAPITNWPLINATDQFARQLGLYVKGVLGGGLINYRVAAVRPFADNVGDPFSPGRSPSTWGVSSYFKLQLLDKESHTLPYEVGTYLGKKKVFNIGVGQHWHPNGSQDADGEAADIFLFGADIFADIPIGEKAEGGAVTAYAVFYNYDFGRDSVIRNVGIMNLGATQRSTPGAVTRFENGGSNSYASIGDGISVYGQFGYLFPGNVGGVQIQPYVTGQINAWDLYNDVAPVIEVGSNFYLYEHHAKFTLNYRARPLMVGGGTFNPDPNSPTNFTFDPEDRGNFDGFASEFILQTMIFL